MPTKKTAKIKSTDNTQYWQGRGKPELSTAVGIESDKTSLGSRLEGFITINTHLQCDSTIPFLGIHAEEWKHMATKYFP